MFKVADETAEDIEKVFKIEVPIEERIFISIPIAGMRTPTNIEAVYQVGITEDIEKTIDWYYNNDDAEFISSDLFDEYIEISKGE